MKKKAPPKKAKSKRKVKRRSQKANKPRKEMEFEIYASAPSLGKKNICANARCKLRSSGCWGYETCPGFKGKA